MQPREKDLHTEDISDH